ncbi:MAG: hypothetical protein CMK59_07350 [Proteobacteria bacterium]|nr:hypothetical protein [Pseudomonadota bacterium]
MNLPVLMMLLFGCDEEKTNNAPSYPDVDSYDFDAAAPWYTCDGLIIPEEATVVTAFAQADQYFGDENLREISAEVDFPDSGDWKQVGLRFRLECPESGPCDHWDRSGSVQLIQNADSESPTRIELARQITPYKLGMCQYIDITPLAGLLKGTQTIASFIDTWVGPGHSDGDGWRTSIDFVFIPGAPQQADEVINIWGFQNITVGEIEAGSTVQDQLEEVSFSAPADATRIEAHLTTTGHSFGNTYNCAEFCKMRNDLSVNGELFTTYPWRNDCEENPVSPQYGTWELNRNGWCPGAIAVGRKIDITDAVELGAENSLTLDLLLNSGSEYDNISPIDLLPYTLLSLKIYIYK